VLVGIMLVGIVPVGIAPVGIGTASRQTNAGWGKQAIFEQNVSLSFVSATCFHVELEQFSACFRVARVCQRQLGFLVLFICLVNFLVFVSLTQNSDKIGLTITLFGPVVVEICLFPLTKLRLIAYKTALLLPHKP